MRVRKMISGYQNPFEYEAATNLPDEMILDVFIEDYNYSRFIQSKRNVFLLGDRGSGKSMTLLFNSFRLKKIESEKKMTKLSRERIGVYIPCNTPLTHKQEYLLLLKDFQASVISEHYLVLSIVYGIAETLALVPDVLDGADEVLLRSEIKIIFGEPLHLSPLFFEALKLYVQEQIIKTQRHINASSSTTIFYENSLTFSTAVLPLLNCLKKIPTLYNSHFLLMIDDAHDLNIFQRRALNSWIAYRDHSLFSFKVAMAKVNDLDYLTVSGGTILEGHDFITIDMEGDFQNQYSNFGKLAKRIIEKRLLRINIEIIPEKFFPTNPSFMSDLEKCKTIASQKARDKYPQGTPKQISDYVYKFARAEYFRGRSSKSNRPPYSGFEMIVDISTGVIRNLLEPCFWMFDDVYSNIKNKSTTAPTITEIPHSVQTKILRKSSEKMWKRLQNGLDKYIDNCSQEQAKQIYNIFNNLAILFKERLMRHASEPRAIVFTISGKDERKDILKPLLDIARRAQFLYERTGVAKDEGKLETYYVPNRMLWPARGLDPHGQFARASLKVEDILNAANDIRFPFAEDDDKVTVPIQEVMFL